MLFYRMPICYHAEQHFGVCHYAECRYALCHDVQCLLAMQLLALGSIYIDEVHGKTLGLVTLGKDLYQGKPRQAKKDG